MSAKSLPSVEKLFSLAFERTKKRFLSFFLASIIGYLIMIPLIFFSAFGIGLLVALKAYSISPIILIVLGIAVGFVVYYLILWSHLAAMAVLIQSDTPGVIATYKRVQSKVLGYVWLMILLTIFMIGLMPIGLALIGIPLILWYFWMAFMIFIYLEKDKPGLESVWMSKAMVSQNFWGIAGRLVIVGATTFFLSFLLNASHNPDLIIVGNLFIWIVMTPFTQSYAYELYKNIDAPKEVKTPTVWIVASAIGLVIGVFLLGSILNNVGTAFPEIMRQYENKKLNKEFDQKYQQELKDPSLNNDNMRPAKIQWGL